MSASLPSCEHWTQSPPPPGKAQRCSPVRKEPADPLSFSDLNSSAVSLFSGKSVTNYQNVKRRVIAPEKNEIPYRVISTSIRSVKTDLKTFPMECLVKRLL